MIDLSDWLQVFFHFISLIVLCSQHEFVSNLSNHGAQSVDKDTKKRQSNDCVDEKTNKRQRQSVDEETNTQQNVDKKTNKQQSLPPPASELLWLKDELRWPMLFGQGRSLAGAQDWREPSGLPTSELATSSQSWGWQFWVCPLLRIANPNYTQEFWL